MKIGNFKKRARIDMNINSCPFFIWNVRFYKTNISENYHQLKYIDNSKYRNYTECIHRIYSVN